jgi:hypothetical protein
MSGDDLVILRNYSGCDEINDAGVAYKVNKWGCVRVPASAVAPLMKTAGFHIASPDDPSAINSTLEDVAEVCWHLPSGKVRDTLLAITASQNSMSHLCQSISFS